MSTGAAQTRPDDCVREFIEELRKPETFLRTETVNALGCFDTRNWGSAGKSALLDALASSRAENDRLKAENAELTRHNDVMRRHCEIEDDQISDYEDACRPTVNATRTKELRDARADIERLTAALEPFAKEADRIEKTSSATARAFNAVVGTCPWSAFENARAALASSPPAETAEGAEQ